MKNVLMLKSSILGGYSSSSALMEKLEQGYKQQGATITSRDLAAEPLPVLTGDIALALRGSDDMSELQKQAVALSDRLIEELKAADVLVMAAPMYNFSIPTQLKNWIDMVARAGVTFKYTEQGAVGLIENTKAVIVTTRGGIHKDSASDTQIPYLKLVLGFLGINEVEVVYAEALNMGEQFAKEQMEQAQEQISSLI